MKNPSYYEDPPEDPPEEIDPMDDGDYAYDTWKDAQHDKDVAARDLNWGPPTNAPFNEPDYQATLDRRHDRK